MKNTCKKVGVFKMAERIILVTYIDSYSGKKGTIAFNELTFNASEWRSKVINPVLYGYMTIDEITDNGESKPIDWNPFGSVSFGGGISLN